ncbi:MAG: tRNA (adenosine(37)-N6)-dimethylallyltransferase MiaA [Planctomycetales bacterium]|nr:tRNA (adenosine(37)-N6)-dimethylallyltransferase MiaA [Planctomycetales bacterium]NIM08385.1 tRNA (adenosine(37)-N6)-dimethylallyltransferase MiaA [Planctomycetales bacterium]NIN07860.1 tRNA (adenosine(37)-N6)-dimethylallyltransferase MiaA [Planctomycetales bacterium]NIN76991.1 tRNA (adenosine(37)-N6)-dimethylallyltransferase MiaA [Planctomycetales bacterium]NIO34174.1 tRNA (adenosine(37)-N6)-dimethylallyltransferase MiaA [Planctomycetales bacterium]
MKTFQPIEDAWYLTGPTASGKSAVGLELAQRLNAEIISMDSMAVYRGMNIGTAKPTAVDLQQVPQHGIDLVDPTTEYSVAEYLEAAHHDAERIRERGRQVLFVGGTPLYLKALLRGLCSGPAADWQLRQRLTAEANVSGAEVLHQRLSQIDPQAAEKLNPQDTRRLIRALEVYDQTGEPISDYQQQFQEPRDDLRRRVFVLNWPRAQLHQRIGQRVDQMFQSGLVAELHQLLDRFGSLSRTAGQAVGYREVAQLLRGECDLATAMENTKIRTRRLARRQLTWFRSLVECRWIELAEPLAPIQLAGQILSEAAD